MKVTIPHTALAETVAIASRALPARPPVPVLGGLLLKAVDGQLTISGFDYTNSAQVSTVEAAIGEPGEVLVSGRLLADITRTLRGEVTLSSDGPRLALESGTARFTLHTLPREEYPALPEAPPASGTVSGRHLADAIAKLAQAAGTDDTLPVLTGIQLDIEDDGKTLRLRATDRYRYAMCTLPWNALNSTTTAHALVPAKTLADHAKTLAATDEVTVALPREHGVIGFTAEAMRATSRILEGGLPKYQQLFPTEFGTVVTADTHDLAAAVKRVALVVSGETPITLDITDRITIRGGTTDEAEAVDEIDATVEGDAVTISFNPQFFITGLDVADAKKVQLKLNGPTKPALLHADDDPPGACQYLIMPVRLTG